MVMLFIVFLAGRHLCFCGPHMLICWWAKSIAMILQLSKCPPADAHVRGAMETKMVACREYDE
jgi:hypothetical protein